MEVTGEARRGEEQQEGREVAGLGWVGGCELSVFFGEAFLVAQIGRAHV